MAVKKRRVPRVRRVLSVTSECVPLIKTGGLADVAGALPAALAPLGWESRVLLPAYPGLLDRVNASGGTRPVWSDPDLYGGPATVSSGNLDGLAVLLLDAPHLFDRPGGPYNMNGYDHPDNHVRFAALSWVGARLAIEGTSDGWRPDLVHAHDWQAGLVPSYLRYAGSDVPSVLTIHNIAFQGLFGPDQLDRLRLPTWDFHFEALEYNGMVSTLKAGMVHASHVTTVSPSYAQELATPEFGFGLDGVARMRLDRGEMSGIVNGIDTAVWDPATDRHLRVHFSADREPGTSGPDVIPDSVDKLVVRADLCREFGLDEPTGPLAVVVTRLTHQKGVDLWLEALPGFLARGGAVAVLGSGDPGYESGLQELAARFPRAVGVRIGYDEPLSHRMYGGGDLVLVPSRFEPCGLTQLYGQRYGAVPVVAATGGLRDTVVDADPQRLADGTATGFSFGDAERGGAIDAGGLGFALGRAVDLFSDHAAWDRLRGSAMRADVGWGKSAATYAKLFERLVTEAGARTER